MSIATRVVTGVLIVPAALVLAMGPAAAANTGEVNVTNTETVQAFLDATGKLDVARVYEQIALQGNGTVDITNPIETRGLRNLDAFGGFETEDGNMIGTFSVDGEKRLRTVSDYSKKLPLDVAVEYSLDGTRVQPGDVVGESGLLEVRYTVRNLTGVPQEITVDDGTGGQVIRTEEVVIPLIGSLTTTLPSSFVDVHSAEANMAGDGRGGTKLSFTMTLFGPIGQPEVSFGYQARVSDGVIPPASLSIVPVSPLDSPTFKGGAESYRGGAESGIQLVAGASEIDTNLLRLRDGAADLLAGLIQLRDGAQELNAGLEGQAAPGAAKLAAGAGEASDGADQLASGASRLHGGLIEAGSKAPQLIDGLDRVADGLKRLDGGLVQLYGGIGQLDENPGVKQLHGGIQQMVAGLGSKTTADTLIYGVETVRAGLAKATARGDSLDQLKGGVDQVKAGHDEALEPGGSIDQLDGGFDMIRTSCGVNLVCVGTVEAVRGQAIPELRESSQAASDGLGQVSGGLAVLKSSLAEAAGGLVRVECGLSNKTLPVCDSEKPGLLEGLGAVDAGITQLVNGVVSQVQGAVGTSTDAPTESLRGGVNALSGGMAQLRDGGAALVSGLDQLTVGARLVSEGNATLADGNRQIASGADRLSDGLNEAAAGSGLLADGLATAADGAPQLEDGAQRLSDEGTKKLVEAGRETATDYGVKYALIAAGAERARTEGMAYGAPDGSLSAMAYSIEIAGVDGEGGRNLLRGLGALVLLGAGAAVPFIRRQGV